MLLGGAYFCEYINGLCAHIPKEADGHPVSVHLKSMFHGGVMTQQQAIMMRLAADMLTAEIGWHVKAAARTAERMELL